MLTEDAFAVVIWSLLWSTVLAPFCFRIVLNRYVAANMAKEATEKENVSLTEDNEKRASAETAVRKRTLSGTVPTMAM